LLSAGIELISLHMNELSYSLGELATNMHAREAEFARTHSIVGVKPGKPRGAMQALLSESEDED
jgi:hypothetical protein